jgi:hypothetical protein
MANDQDDVIDEFVELALEVFDQQLDGIQTQNSSEMIYKHIAAERSLLQSLSSRRCDARLQLLRSMDERRKRRNLAQQISLSFLSMPNSDDVSSSITRDVMQSWTDNSLSLRASLESIDEDLHQRVVHTAQLLQDNGICDDLELDRVYLDLQSNLFDSFERTWQRVSRLPATSIDDRQVKDLLLQEFESSSKTNHGLIESMRSRASALLAKRLANRERSGDAAVSTEIDSLLLNDIFADPLRAMGIDSIFSPIESSCSKQIQSTTGGWVDRQKIDALRAAHSQKERDLVMLYLLCLYYVAYF